MSLPDSVRRRFPDHPDLDPEASSSFVIARLLEEGTCIELAWLFRRYGTDRIVAWWRRSGGRRLSSRSQGFWRHRLGPCDDPHPLARQLWPLA